MSQWWLKKLICCEGLKPTTPKSAWTRYCFIHPTRNCQSPSSIKHVNSSSSYNALHVTQRTICGFQTTGFELLTTYTVQHPFINTFVRHDLTSALMNEAHRQREPVTKTEVQEGEVGKTPRRKQLILLHQPKSVCLLVVLHSLWGAEFNDMARHPTGSISQG